MKSRSFNERRPGYHWPGFSLLLLLFYGCVQISAAEPVAGSFSGDLPPWPKPAVTELPAKAPALRTPDLEVVQSP
ncbi:MAG TPA: hypothetical protein VHI52_07805, partial [Verrucomicrobiae bacterium]|nr:hypothetical protein [Verrucomicrobiae bacterium]